MPETVRWKSVLIVLLILSYPLASEAGSRKNRGNGRQSTRQELTRYQHATKSTPSAPQECGQALLDQTVKTPEIPDEKLEPAVQRAALGYFKANTPNFGGLSEVKVVGRSGDAIFVVQDEVLKIARMTSLSGAQATVTPLEGDTLVWSQKIGNFFFVRTRDSKSRNGATHRFVILDTDLEVVDGPYTMTENVMLYQLPLSMPDHFLVWTGQFAWTVSRYETEHNYVERARQSGRSVLYVHNFRREIVSVHEANSRFLDFQLAREATDNHNGKNRSDQQQLETVTVSLIPFSQISNSTREKDVRLSTHEAKPLRLFNVPTLDGGFVHLNPTTSGNLEIEAGYLIPSSGRRGVYYHRSSATRSADKSEDGFPQEHQILPPRSKNAIQSYVVETRQKGELHSSAVVLFPTHKMAEAPPFSWGTDAPYPNIRLHSRLRQVEGVAESSNLLVVETFDSARDERRMLSGDPATSLEDQITYTLYHCAGSPHSDNYAVRIRTKHPLSEFRTKHPVLGQVGQRFLFAKMHGSEEYGTMDVLIDLRHGAVLLVPEVTEAHDIHAGSHRYRLFRHPLPSGNSYLGIIDLKFEALVPLTATLKEQKGEDALDRMDFDVMAGHFVSTRKPVLHSNAYIAREVEIAESLSQLKVEYLAAARLTRLRGTWTKEKDEPSEIWFDENGHTQVLYKIRRLDFVRSTFTKEDQKPSLLEVFEAWAPPKIEESSGEKPRREVVLVFKDRPMKRLNISGAITSLNHIVDDGFGERILADFETPTTTDAYRGRFYWVLSGDRFQVLENLRDGVAYQDDEVTFMVGDPILNGKTGVYFTTPKKAVPVPVDLSVRSGDKKTEQEKSWDDFIEWLFGKKPTDPERNQVESIQRRGDWVFIQMKRTGESPARCYFWSVSREAISFALPNYKADVVFEGKRFFVSQASARTDAVVAVVDDKTGQLLNYFNLRKLPLDFEHPEFVQFDTEARRLGFRAKDGSYRYYDEVKDTFLGLLPDDVQKMVDELEEESLGHCLNTQIFSRTSDPSYGRESVRDQVNRHLFTESGERATQLLLVAESGAGSTHIVRQVTEGYVHGSIASANEQRMVFFSLDTDNIMAGTKYRGTFADKFTKIREVSKRLSAKGYRLILILENAHRYEVQPHNWGEGNTHEKLAKLMEDSAISLLATTTPEGKNRLMHNHPFFMKQFGAEVVMNPMSLEETTDAVRYVAMAWGREVAVAPQVLNGVFKTVSRFSHGALPGPAMDLVKNLLREDVQGDLTRADFLRSLTQTSGVPEILLDLPSLEQNLADLRRKLIERVKARDVIIDELINGLRAFALGLRRPDWPIRRLLINGFTGVGKTELARALADILLPNPKALKMIDCTEYQNKEDIKKLKHELADHYRKYPFNIVLFDEIEKMHPDVRNIMLLLGDGTFTDEFGNPISSSLSIILATSNAGTDEAIEAIRKGRSAIGFGITTVDGEFRDMSPGEIDRVKKILKKAIESDFSGPFRNRFDNWYCALPISTDDASSIIAQYLIIRRDRGSEIGLDLRFHESVQPYLVAEYMTWELGGRRLAIDIERELTDSFISQMVATGTIKPGIPVEVYVEKDELKARSLDGNRR